MFWGPLNLGALCGRTARTCLDTGLRWTAQKSEPEAQGILLYWSTTNVDVYMCAVTAVSQTYVPNIHKNLYVLLYSRIYLVHNCRLVATMVLPIHMLMCLGGTS